MERKEAGKGLREIMKPGAKIDLSIFSNLDSNRFLQEIITDSNKNIIIGNLFHA